MRAALLAWYDREGRALPWRVRPEDRAAGVRPDPYAIWLSEVMLQQTTIPHGTPYWHKFLSLYPTVEDLARAPLDDVLTHWAGLGYYARARNLHKCAKAVVERGGWPKTKAELQKLPGIGDYTASTIAAICFSEPTTIVDGNVERVISRIHRVEEPLPKAKKTLKALAAVLSDPERSGDYGQAVMDLGATICTPKSPSCLICPWAQWCAARMAGDQTRYPVKAPKKKQPVRYSNAFVAVKGHEVWLQRRPDEGLLGGMMEVPNSAWVAEAEAEAEEMIPPVPADWQATGDIRHLFTHIDLRLRVFRADVKGDLPGEGRWVAVDRLGDEALPSLMRKVLDAALASSGG